MINSMEVTELQDLINQDADIILIDCREQDEWDAGHLPKARFMPLSNWEAASAELDSTKDKKIVIQCRSGKRSFNACMNLMDRGFEDLYNLEGGILAWQEAGYPVIQD